MWVEELQATPELLPGWAAAFDADDDVTLVVIVPAEDTRALAWLEQEVDATGLAADGAADVLAVALGPDDELPAVDAIWSLRRDAGRFGRPVLDAVPDRARLAELRVELLEARQARLEAALGALVELADDRAAALRREVDGRLAAADPGAAGRFSPLLWHEVGRGPEPARASPATQLAALGDTAAQREALAAAIAVQLPSVQRAALEAEPLDAVLARGLADDLPTPTQSDREGYFDDDLAYWVNGLGDALTLAAVAEGRGRPLAAGHRLLDLGCATGRVLRHLHANHPGLELHGSDIGRHHVEWARRHLPAEVLVAQNTVLPGLPLADDSIDVVYAGSVFTHTADFEEGWLLELRRVLRPEGFAFLTIHRERTWREMGDPGALRDPQRHAHGAPRRAARDRAGHPGAVRRGNAGAAGRPAQPRGGLQRDRGPHPCVDRAALGAPLHDRARAGACAR